MKKINVCKNKEDISCSCLYSQRSRYSSMDIDNRMEIGCLGLWSSVKDLTGVDFHCACFQIIMRVRLLTVEFLRFSLKTMSHRLSRSVHTCGEYRFANKLPWISHRPHAKRKNRHKNLLEFIRGMRYPIAMEPITFSYGVFWQR